MDPSPSTYADLSDLAVDTLKASSALVDAHPAPRLATPRKRSLATLPQKRLSTASALAESLTTPPPPYETATRSSSPPPSPSAHRTRTPRARPQPVPASADGDGDDDESDPTSDSDDPLNHLLRLTGSLLSTSTSILASSTALHSSLSRLLSSDAVARPPHLAHADSRAELELRSGVDAADRAGERLSQLESATERWARRASAPQAGASSSGTSSGRIARGEAPLVGRQEHAERPRTLYATATGAGSGFLAGLAGGAEGDQDEAAGSRSEEERPGPPAHGAPRPIQRSASAAQDLLGRLAGRELPASAVEVERQVDDGDDEPAIEQAPRSIASSRSRTALYSLAEEQASAPSAGGEFRNSALASSSTGGPPPSSLASTSAAPPRTPTSRRRSTPFQLATPSPATVASSTSSPRPSPSSLLAPSPSRARDIRTPTPLSTTLVSPSSTTDGLGITSSSTASSPSTSPASSRPSQHRRTSTAAASAAAFATSLSQHRAATTTSLAHDLDGGRDSLAAVVRAGAGSGAAGSARGALQALSASAAAGGAGGATSMPGAQVGKAEGRAGGAASGLGEGAVGASWWSWS